MNFSYQMYEMALAALRIVWRDQSCRRSLLFQLRSQFAGCASSGIYRAIRADTTCTSKCARSERTGCGDTRCNASSICA